MQKAAEKLTPFVATSVVLHVGLFLAVAFIPSLFPSKIEATWGTSTDKGIRVGVTSSLPGIPLPSPPVVQEDATPNESDTLNPPEVAPEPAPQTPPKPADIQIPSNTKPEKKKETPAPPRVARGDVKPPVDAPPSNAVPGRGGQIALPYGGQASGAGQATFGGDGTFGTRFPQYVVAMTRAITLAWQENLGGVPRGTPRVYVTFTIDRQGQVTNMAIDQSSGLVQLDNSAKRAVLVAKLPPLPREYSGSTVDVRFYFEYTR